MQEEELDSLREIIEAVDQNRPPLRVINGYSILDHLGTGAFGSVFKVQQTSRSRERNRSVNKLQMIRSALDHRSESKAARTSWL